MRNQARASAAALSKMRAADATHSKDTTVQRIAGVLYVWMLEMRDISHRAITVTTAVTIMLLATVTVTAVAWHGRGRWY
jgi:hypothetical protein